MKNSIIQIYTGEGKGKTTAAIGSALRAAGHNFKVIIFQFLKHGNFKTGEEKLKNLKNITFVKFKEKSPIFDKSIKIYDLKKQVKKDVEKVFKIINSKKYDLVILDEFTYLLKYKLVDEKIVIQKLKERPENVDIIITGRNVTQNLKKIADLITYMKEVKHPFKSGIIARKGIDF